MTLAGKPFVIALEEHYYDPELAATFDGPEGRAPETRRRLDDLGELRLKEMDEAGIDVQVISHGAPSTQRLDAEAAVRLARNANDRLSCGDRRASRPVCCLRSPADPRPQGCRRRAGTHGDPAGV